MRSLPLVGSFTIAVAAILSLTVAACAGDTTTNDTATAAATPTASTAPDPPPPQPEPAGDEEAPDTTLFDYGGGATTGEDLYPDVVGATAVQAADGSWTFAVTLSSPYDSAERYADAWRVLAPDGTELGVRVLAHHHANEQPFTRSVAGIRIPDDVSAVVIEGRDQLSGWGGATFELTLSR